MELWGTYSRCSSGFAIRDSFILRSCDEPIPYRLLAGKLTRATRRLGSLPRCSLRWLLVKPAPFHFPKHTFALHFLLQDAKSLIDIVVSDEHLQKLTPYVVVSFKVEAVREDGANEKSRNRGD
jgi:hypothetical protein